MSEIETELQTWDALLDTDLDNIEDLPEFELFSKGIYNLVGKTVKIMEADPDNEKDGGVMFVMENAGVVELENPEQEPTKEGALISTAFVGNFGMRKMKQVFGDVMTGLNCNTPREFLDQFVGAEFVAVVSHRKDKNDPDRVYNDIKNTVLQ